MSYALQTLWFEKARYAAGVGAVLFSAVLIALQVGLLLGLFEITSIPIDHTDADVWVGEADVESVDLGKPISMSLIGRLDLPGVESPEPLFLNFANYTKATGGSNLCVVVGSRLDPDAVSKADVLTPEMCAALTENLTVVVDASDMERLGMTAVGDKGKINGREVRLVGTVSGLKSLAAPWVFCSQTTARTILGVNNPDYATGATYLLARTKSPERAGEVVRELRAEYPDLTVYTAAEFSAQTRWYWLTRTKAGLALGYAALLGLLVGAVITAQTLYSATMSSAREFATLLALGIPRKRIARLVLAQSFWVGLVGVCLAMPVVYGLALVADSVGTRVVMRWEIFAGAAVLTLGTAILSGFIALRSVQRIEPMSLLR